MGKLPRPGYLHPRRASCPEAASSPGASCPGWGARYPGVSSPPGGKLLRGFTPGGKLPRVQDKPVHRKIIWVNINQFWPHLVYALILCTTGLGISSILDSYVPTTGPYFRFRMTSWININWFSPNLVCALILWRSDLWLLMGKFHQFLTDLSACRTIVSHFYPMWDDFFFSFWIILQESNTDDVRFGQWRSSISWELLMNIIIEKIHRKQVCFKWG